MKCDFCGAAPRWRYRARSFAVENIPGVGSQSDWAACNGCRVLIDADKREQLARRALMTHPTLGSLADTEIGEDMLNEIRLVHNQFFANRFGEAEPLSTRKDEH